MAEDTRNANVVLSADVSGYTAGTQQAYQETNKLIESVNKLASSMDGITKRAGKKIMLFAAADLAMATGMVAVTAKYEKQLATLNAQMTISGKSIGIFKKGINDMARDMPISRGELAQLATQIHELGVSSEREAVKMVRVFSQLSAATGEDVGALTSGMIELSRQMGTLNNGAQGISNFSDSLTSVSAAAGVSATSVLNFAQSISPFARAAGMGQKELLGVSAAFTRAGADGYAAANAFTSILGDITRQTQTGSPEIAKYANVVGLTVEQFKALGPSDQLSKIFDAVNAAGPDAIKVLDRLGIDGIRAAKAFAAVSSEQGGLAKAIKESTAAYGNGSTEKGAGAAFDTLDSKATKLKNNMEQIASSIGEGVMPFAKALLDTLNAMLNVVNQIAQPLLKLGGALAAVIAPISAAIGGLSSLMGPLSTLMMGFLAFRLTPMRAMFQGMGEGAAARAGLGTPLSSIGQRVMMARQFTEAGMPVPQALRVPWYQQWGYNVGRALGDTRFGAVAPALGARGLLAGGTWAARGVGAVARGMREWAQDATLRGDALWGRRSMGQMLQGPIDRAGGFFRAVGAGLANEDGSGAMKNFRSELDKASKATATAAAATTTNTAATKAATTAVVAEEATRKMSLGERIKAELNAAGTTEAFSAALKKATGQLAMYPLSMANFGRKAAGQIAGAGANVLGSVGSMLGFTGGAATGVGAGVAAAVAGYLMINKQKELSAENIVNKETPRNIAATNTALGLPTEALGQFSDVIKVTSEGMQKFSTVTDAMTYSVRSASAVLGEFADKNFERLSTKEQVLGYLQAQGTLTPQQAASLSSDVIKKLGVVEGQSTVNDYLRETSGGSNPYNNQMFNRLISGSIKTQEANQGFEGPFSSIGQFFTSSDASKQIEAAFVGAAQDATSTESSRHGERYTNQKLATYVNDALRAAFDNRATSSPFFSMAETKVQEQVIKQLESTFDAEGNYTFGPRGMVSGLNSNFKSAEDIMRDLFNEENQSPLAKKVRDWGKANNLTAADFTSSGAAALEDSVAKRKINGDYSPWETQIRATSLGKFARESTSIDAVTTGSAINDPMAVTNSIKYLSEEASRGGRSVSEVTASFQELKRVVGDVNDPLYRLAVSAQALYESQQMYMANATKTSFAAEQEQMDIWKAKAEAPVNTPEGQTERNDAINNINAANLGDIQKLKQLNNTVYEFNKQQEYAEKDHLRQQQETLEDYGRQTTESIYQFNKQQEYAYADHHRQVKWAENEFYLQRKYQMQDFGRSMKRAAEDAAKTMWDPFQRPVSRPTLSSGQTTFNLQQQLKLMKDQVKNLDKLRKMGVSQAVIDTLNLTDPSMAFQVQRFVDEGKSLNVAGLNKYGGAARTAAAGAVLHEQQGTRRTEEDFYRGMDRSEKAFRKSLRHSEIEFRLSLKRGEDAFQHSLELSATNFQISWDRMELSYTTGKDRAKQALLDYGREISGTVEQQIADTSARLFQALGTDTQNFFNTLHWQLVNNNAGEPYNPDWTGTQGVPGDSRDKRGAFGPSALHKPGPENAWQSEGKWWGMTNGGVIFELGDGWNNKTRGNRLEVRWNQAARAAGVELAVGGIATRQTNATIGEAGPEAVIPLNNAGAAFMGKLFGQITMEMAKSMRTSGFDSPTAYRGGAGSVQYNNTTNFNLTGDVVAEDPNRLVGELKRRAALHNLKTGAASPTIP